MCVCVLVLSITLRERQNRWWNRERGKQSDYRPSQLIRDGLRGNIIHIAQNWSACCVYCALLVGVVVVIALVVLFPVFSSMFLHAEFLVFVVLHIG